MAFVSNPCFFVGLFHYYCKTLCQLQITTPKCGAKVWCYNDNDDYSERQQRLANSLRRSTLFWDAIKPNIADTRFTDSKPPAYRWGQDLAFDFWVPSRFKLLIQKTKLPARR